MNNVSTVRLYLLRAMYLLVAVGLALTVWPVILVPILIPWGFVLQHYFRAPGEPWRKQASPQGPPSAA